MAEKGFEPLSSQLGIAGTSYRLQLGLINEKWASRVLKGKDIIDSYVYKEEDLADNGAPNQNLIVGWVLRTLTLPNINPYQIMKTTNALVKQALEKKDQRKVMASVEDAKEVKLEVVPESELKRPQAKGWVKEDGQKSREDIEEEQRKAFKERMMQKQEPEGPKATSESVPEPVKSSGSEPVKTAKTSRKLPSIPSAGSETLATQDSSPEPAASSVSAGTAEKKEDDDVSNFCPHCGKDIAWKFCPFCGKPLPHTH